ncbi:hypothetical protein LSM04_005233 [Trypanosoma melophagium]|uniref:uncharacterized protein n=1 Tax=Trypanosoma melophagium TaxID=715481 RepID=UPI00351A32DD|nr:hypothetical protein LSM04_005233 [Trypanosoma melophagium]
MDGVEHVKIGKHIFPLYSHPLVRAKLQEEAYVEQRIKEQLRNPRLQLAVNEVVEELLKQSITGDVSEEDTAKYIEEALTRLDVFYQAREERKYPTSPSPPQQGLTSSHNNNNNNNKKKKKKNDSAGTTLYNSDNNSNERKTNMGHTTLRDNTVKVVQKITIPPKPRLAPIVERNNRTLSHLNRSHPLPKLRNIRKQQQQKEQGIISLHKPKEVELDEKMQGNDVGILYGPVAVPWRRFLPSDMERDDRSEHLTTSSQREEDEKEEEREKQEFKQEQEEISVSPPPVVKQVPPEWRNAVRSLFYSMISLRVEECGGVQFQEMDLRSSAQRLLKLQGAELDSLSQDAFGALDITMDGNSSAIHCRPKVAPSIIQSSRIQQAEKAMKLKPSTLRLQTISALTQSNANSSSSEGYIRVAGASLKHPWLDNSVLLTAATPVESKNQFELPSATYRSRILGSVLEMKSPR